MSDQDTREKTQMVVAIAVVLNDQGELLLARRHEPELPEAHDRLELPGGRVEHGEDPHVTAEREILEETGYVIGADPASAVVRSKVWHYPEFDRHTIVIAYRAQLTGGQRRVEGGKVKDVVWIPLADVPMDDLLGESREFITALVPEMRANGLK